METLNRITEMLKNNNIVFEKIEHEATFTSEESAKVRGEELKNGAKAILLKTDNGFNLFILSAILKIDSTNIKDFLKVKKTRFATAEELLEKTGLVPGSVPPFGEPILPFNLYIDTSISDLERIAFNAGSLTTSIKMSAKDYLKVSNGVIFDFALK